MKRNKSTQAKLKERPSTNSSQNFKIYITSTFKAEAEALKKKYPNIKDDFMLLKDQLRKDPITGNDKLGQNCYKIRMSISDKNAGKRQGARIIINVLVEDRTVYVLSAISKGTKDSWTDKEIEDLLKKKLR